MKRKTALETALEAAPEAAFEITFETESKAASERRPFLIGSGAKGTAYVDVVFSKC